MNACEASQDSQLQGYALRFVEHCISQLQSTDTTLHNLAVHISTLHMRQEFTMFSISPLTRCSGTPAGGLGSQASCCVQVTLYSQDADEQRLLHYLRTARGTLGSPLYDPQFALQVARQHGKLIACVQLLCELSLHEVGASTSVQSC